MQKVYRKLELTEALRNIVSRNTENNQTEYAYDMRELINGSEKNYLFACHSYGTMLFPETAVYCADHPAHEAWLSLASGEYFNVLAYAVHVSKRTEVGITGDLLPLHLEDQLVDVELCSGPVQYPDKVIKNHVADMQHARNRLETAPSFHSYLRTLGNRFAERAHAYHPGMRRICIADAFLLVRDDTIPVYRLDCGQNWTKPLHSSEVYPEPGAAYGISIRSSPAYDRWQRRVLDEFISAREQSRGWRKEPKDLTRSYSRIYHTALAQYAEEG